MTTKDVLTLRLTNQQLTNTHLKTPDEVVSWFGAVQSQDYPSAKWAVGQRLKSVTDEIVEQAFAKGEILRTHVMRPTWHFVHPSDIRWMLMLTGPRVNAVMAPYNRKLELDDAFFKKSNQAIIKSLSGNKQLTRAELGERLRQSGLDPKSPFRLSFIVSRAELDGIICSGAKKGKQFTYALIEEVAPKAKTMTREEALAELVMRYYTSHGPAQINDFVWWSGLTVADTKKGIEMNTSHLIRETVDGKLYYFARSTRLAESKRAYLLPNYDEYTIAYKDRSAFYPVQPVPSPNPRENVPFNNTIIFEGVIIGMWKRTLKKDSIIIESRFFIKPSPIQYQAFKTAADRLGKFLGMSVILSS